jgi:hypothetical protein
LIFLIVGFFVVVKAPTLMVVNLFVVVVVVFWLYSCFPVFVCKGPDDGVGGGWMIFFVKAPNGAGICLSIRLINLIS